MNYQDEKIRKAYRIASNRFLNPAVYYRKYGMKATANWPIHIDGSVITTDLHTACKVNLDVGMDADGLLDRKTWNTTKPVSHDNDINFNEEECVEWCVTDANFVKLFLDVCDDHVKSKQIAPLSEVVVFDSKRYQTLKPNVDLGKFSKDLKIFPWGGDVYPVNALVKLEKLPFKKRAMYIINDAVIPENELGSEMRKIHGVMFYTNDNDVTAMVMPCTSLAASEYNWVGGGD